MRVIGDWMNSYPSSPCTPGDYAETEDYTFIVSVGCTAPTTQASSFTSSAITDNTMTVGWTRGNGDNVMVVARAGSAPTNPSSGISYTANAAYGSGDACGGGFVVYNGPATSVNLTALSMGTTYYFAIYEYYTTDVCYFLTELTGSATTTGASPYCIPSMITASAGGDYIGNFTFAGINNTTGDEATDYTYYSSLTANVIAGDSYPVSLMAGGSTSLYEQQFGVWIDYNQNGVFTDVGEFVFATTTATYSPTVATGTIAIPALSGTVLSGTTRLRVGSRYSTAVASTNSCLGGSDYGEYEDYNVTIIAPTPCSGTPAAGTVTPTSASICTGGSETIDLTGYTTDGGMSFQWQSATSIGGPYSNISGATSTTYDASPAVTTYYQCVSTCSNSTLSNTSDIATITVVIPVVTSTTPGSVCGMGTVDLGATGSAGSTLNWYDVASGGSSIGTGTSFTTPVISTTTDYYVSANVGGAGTTVGGLASPLGTATTSSSDWGLVFDAYQAFTLLSVDVYSTGVGNVVVELQNSSGTMLQTTTVAVTAAGTGTPQTIPINFNVPVGTDLRLIAVSSPIMVRDYSASFPYSLGANGDITSGYISGVSTTYYYFYNWIMSGGGCESAMTMVTATVTAPPALALSSTAEEICDGNSVAINVTPATVGNYPSYSWSPATGATESGSPLGSIVTFDPTTTTTYTVTATDGTCTTIATVDVTVNQLSPAAGSPDPYDGETDVCYDGTSPVSSISWGHVIGATSYDVYFGAGSLPGTLTANVGTNSYSTGALAANTTYYWQIVPKNACGDALSPVTWTFTTAIVPCIYDCEWILSLEDYTGDGWDGGSVEIFVNGSSIGFAWLASGAGPEYYAIPVVIGDEIFIEYTSGGVDSDDDDFHVYDSDGWLNASSSDYPYNTPTDITISNVYCGSACSNGIAFCNDDGYLFPASVDAPGYGDIGCLGSTPNPAWYYMEIDNPGDLVIDITSDGDVDFIAWGPYTSVGDACSTIPMVTCAACPNNTDDALYYPDGEIVDCSYDIAAFETVHINGAQAGEIYVLLITNYADIITDIEFSATVASTATTNCGIVAPPINNNGPLCMGESLQLSPTYPISGASYSWTGPGGWTSSLENPIITNVTAADLGDYSLVVTLVPYTSATVTTTVSVLIPDDTGLANGDYVWYGFNSTDWLTSSNWLEYDGTSDYTFATAAPDNSTNVYLRDYATCITNIATIGDGLTGNCTDLINETNLIMGNNSLINVSGDWTCTGVFTSGTGTTLFNLGFAQTVSPGGNPFYNLTINKTAGNVTALQDIECQSNFLSTSAASIFNLNNLTFTLGGNFTNNSAATTFTNTANSTFIFNGSGSQDYSPGGTLNLNDVTINNTGTGINLLGNLISDADGIMTFTNGIVHGGSNIAEVLNSTVAGVNVGNTDSYVNGIIRRHISSNGTFYMPVGNSIQYALAEVNNSGLNGVSYLDAQFLGTFTNTGALDPLLAIDFGTPYQDICTEGIWQIDADAVPSAGTYDIMLTFDDGGGGNPFSGLIDNQFGILKRSTSSTLAADWAGASIGTLPAAGNPGRLVTDGFAKRTGIDSFSHFAIGRSGFPLPVELVNFSAFCDKNKITFDWATAAEINNDYFTLENSSDLLTFIPIKTIEGAGNSNEIKYYSVNDFNNNDDVTYYRLKQTDFDGNFKYSEILSVTCKDNNVSAYAFVDAGTGNIVLKTFGIVEDDCIVYMIDYTGRTVIQKSLSLKNLENNIIFTNKGISAGLYNIVLQTSNNIITKQIVISR